MSSKSYWAPSTLHLSVTTENKCATMEMDCNSCRILSRDIRLWKPHPAYRFRPYVWRVQDATVKRRGFRGRWHNNKAIFFTTRAERLGRAVADSGGVFPPESKDLFAYCLVVTLLGVLTERARNVEQ
jgi:hypothetical protein